MKRFDLGLSLLVVVLLVGALHAAVPKTINYQGVLKDGSGNRVTGTVTLDITIYDASNSAVHTQNFPSVAVADGLFNVVIGPTTALFDEQYELGVSVNAGPEMTPRKPLTASPYAIRADVADVTRGYTSQSNVVPGTGAVLVGTLTQQDGSQLTVSQGSGATPVSTFSVGGDTAVRIESRNAFGDARLDFANEADADHRWSLGRTNAGGFFIRDWTTDSSGLAQRMTFDSGSNMAINKAVDANATLSIADSGENVVLKLAADTPFDEAQVVFENLGDSIDTTTWTLRRVNGEFAINSGGVNTILLEPNNRVGINENNPAARLHVRESVDPDSVVPVALFELDRGGDAQVHVRAKSAFGNTVLQLKNESDLNNHWSFYRANTSGNFVLRALSPVNASRMVVDPASGDTEFFGEVDAVAFNTTSDVRLKQNIQPLSNALDTVTNLRGVTFDWTSGDHPGGNIGFVAQEVEAVAPELVSTNDNGMKSVAYGNVAPLLVEAIKAQQATIEQQRQELEQLKAAVQALQQQLQP